jgi:hypothetical protein
MSVTFFCFHNFSAHTGKTLENSCPYIGRDFSREPGIQAPKKSIKVLVLTFQVELLSGFPVNKSKFLFIRIISRKMLENIHFIYIFWHYCQAQLSWQLQLQLRKLYNHSFHQPTNHQPEKYQ